MRTRKLFLAALLLMAGRAGAQVAAPAPVYPLPSPEHMEWQRLEQYAMICFGMSTFNDLEWGYGDTPLERFAPIPLEERLMQSSGWKYVKNPE